MANPYEILAEARIRDWQQRKAAGEIITEVPQGPGDSLESQLLRRVVGLIEQAAHAQPGERQRLEREARDAEIRLMVTLEGNGLPLASRRIAAELERIRAEKNHVPSR